MDSRCRMCHRQLQSLTNGFRTEKVKEKCSIVNVQLRVESWLHPLGRLRQLLVSPQQDTLFGRHLKHVMTESRSDILLSVLLRKEQ